MSGRPPGLRRGALGGLVFFAGIGTMATEMCASRLLAPYYGSSTMIWANIIGLILIALSLGYVLGGKLADKHPSPRVLGFVVLGGAVLTAAVPFAARPFLNVTINGIDSVSMGAVFGSFFACVVLFVPSVLLLGMVTPFAIRIGIRDVGKAGSTAGRIFALSTAGSLLGTFLPRLVTIPLIGTQRTLLAAAALIAAAAALLLGARWLVVAVAIAALIAIPPGAVKATAGLIYEKESRYQFIQVVERRRQRLLYLNEGYAVHSVWRPDTVLTGGEWDMFLAVPPLLDRPGGAGGHPGQRRRHDRPLVRRVLPRRDIRRGGDRLRGEQGGGPLLRPGRQSPAHRGHRRRPTLPAGHANGEVRPHLHRRLPAALRALLSGHGRVLRSLPRAPGPRRHHGAEHLHGPGRRPAVALHRRHAGHPVPSGDEVARPALQPAGARVRERAGSRRARSAGRTGAGGSPAPHRLMTDGMDARCAPMADYWTDDRAPVEWITDRMIVSYGTSGKDRGEQMLPTAP